MVSLIPRLLWGEILGMRLSHGIILVQVLIPILSTPKHIVSKFEPRLNLILLRILPQDKIRNRTPKFGASCGRILVYIVQFSQVGHSREWFCCELEWVRSLLLVARNRRSSPDHSTSTLNWLAESVASSSGHSQILSHNHGGCKIKSVSGLRTRLYIRAATIWLNFISYVM